MIYIIDSFDIARLVKIKDDTEIMCSVSKADQDEVAEALEDSDWQFVICVNDQELPKRICEAFDIQADNEQGAEIDMNENDVTYVATLTDDKIVWHSITVW